MKLIIRILLLIILFFPLVNAQDTTKSNIITKVDSDKITKVGIDSLPFNQNANNFNQDSKSENLGLWVIIIIEGFGLVICFVILFMRTDSKRIKDITVNSDRLREKFVLKKEFMQVKSYNDVTMFENKIQRLERMFGDLQKRFDDYSSTVKEDHKFITKFDVKQENIITNQPISVSTQSHKEIKYLKQRNGNIFNQTSDSSEGCHFLMFDIQTDIAKFKFCGKEDYAINNKNEVFDDVCIVSGSSYNAKKILHEDNGEVTLQEGKWTVTKKAKIKFI